MKCRQRRSFTDEVISKKDNIMERIASIPALAISFIAAFLVFIINAFLSSIISQPLSYVIYSMSLAFASFLICILHPKQVWIVPLICNIFIIPIALLDDSFWTSNFGLIIGLGLVFSFLMAHLGALLGRRRESRNTIKSD
jgi:hypothetical protein